jgi:tetratricopeptide (TPR) repeat protein
MEGGVVAAGLGTVIAEAVAAVRAGSLAGLALASAPVTPEREAAVEAVLREVGRVCGDEAAGAALLAELGRWVSAGLAGRLAAPAEAAMRWLLERGVARGGRRLGRVIIEALRAELAAAPGDVARARGLVRLLGRAVACHAAGDELLIARLLAEEAVGHGRALLRAALTDDDAVEAAAALGRLARLLHREAMTPPFPDGDEASDPRIVQEGALLDEVRGLLDRLSAEAAASEAAQVERVRLLMSEARLARSLGRPGAEALHAEAHARVCALDAAAPGRHGRMRASVEVDLSGAALARDRVEADGLLDAAIGRLRASVDAGEAAAVAAPDEVRDIGDATSTRCLLERLAQRGARRQARDRPGAVADLEEAIALIRRLLASPAREPADTQRYVELLRELVQLLDAEPRGPALEAHADELAGVVTRLRATAGADPDFCDGMLGLALDARARAARGRGALAEALRWAWQAVEVRRRLLDACARPEAETALMLGLMLVVRLGLDAGDVLAATIASEEAVTRGRALVARLPDRRSLRNDLSLALLLSSYVADAKQRTKEARERRGEAMAVLLGLRAAN